MKMILPRYWNAIIQAKYFSEDVGESTRKIHAGKKQENAYVHKQDITFLPKMMKNTCIDFHLTALCTCTLILR